MKRPAVLTLQPSSLSHHFPNRPRRRFLASWSRRPISMMSALTRLPSLRISQACSARMGSVAARAPRSTGGTCGTVAGRLFVTATPFGRRRVAAPRGFLFPSAAAFLRAPPPVLVADASVLQRGDPPAFPDLKVGLATMRPVELVLGRHSHFRVRGPPLDGADALAVPPSLLGS